MAPGQFESCTAHHRKPLKPLGFKGFSFLPKNAVKISGKCVVFAAKRVDNGYREKGGATPHGGQGDHTPAF